jgi:tetratricopeptide (TPR) repeat protein
MESWHGRKISPVYNLMPNLHEPDWKSLRVGDVREFWEQYRVWENRLELARKAGRIGDVLVLAEEAPVAAFRAEAWIKAGESLRKAERFRFALENLEQGLQIEPENLRALREKGICLQRLALAGVPGDSLDRAREHYRDVLKLYPTDPETWTLLGRVDKDAWVAAWRQPGRLPEQMREDAAYEDALLRAAIDNHALAFRANAGHYYSGINALTLMHLYSYLTNDPRYDRDMGISAGAVRFAADCEPDQQQLYWSKTTLGDLEVLVGAPTRSGPLTGKRSRRTSTIGFRSIRRPPSCCCSRISASAGKRSRPALPRSTARLRVLTSPKIGSRAKCCCSAGT